MINSEQAENLLDALESVIRASSGFHNVRS